MKKTIAAMLALLMLLTLPLASLAEGWTNPSEEKLLTVGALTVPVPADWQSEQVDEGVMLAPWNDPEVGLGFMMSDLGMDMTSQGDTIVTMLLEMVAVGIAEGMGVDVSDNKEYVTVDGRKALRIGCTDDEGDAVLMVVAPDGSTVYVLLALASDASVMEAMEPYFDSIVERATLGGEAPALPETPATPAPSVPAAAYDGPIDPSALSGEELLALREAVAAEQKTRDEWQSVEVPKGVYTVGTDIPAAGWTISAVEGATAYIYWCDALDASGTGMSWDGELHEHAYIKDPGYRYADPGDPDHVDWTMKDGQYFIVDDGIAVFTPYAGKTFAQFDGLGTPANTSFDLSAYDWQGLIDLRAQCEVALWNACGGKAALTAGVYVVGKDLPAGKYTIAPQEGASCFIYWGDTLDESGCGLSFAGDIFNSEYLKSETFAYYSKGDATKVTWDMKDGQYFIVDDGIAVFCAPEAAKLGFK